jgi:hypothetical protein
MELPPGAAYAKSPKIQARRAPLHMQKFKGRLRP